VQEQSACKMLFTFIRAVAKQCKTKLFVRCFPQFGHSTKEQLPTKHTVSEMRPPLEHAAAIAHPQPLRTFHSASATQGCKTLTKKAGARNIDKQQQTTLK